MRARDLVGAVPDRDLDTPAIDAARLLAGQDLPGLIVVDDRGPAVDDPARHPGAADGGPVVLPGRPGAGPGDRRGGRRRVPARAGRPHRRASACPSSQRELPVVDPDATVLEIAALMARTRSPLVAVVDRKEGLLGAVTLDALLDRLVAS